MKKTIAVLFVLIVLLEQNIYCSLWSDLGQALAGVGSAAALFFAPEFAPLITVGSAGLDLI